MNRIRLLRKAKGRTMKDLAEFFGVTETAISYYETEKREPPIKLLKAFADYFHVSIDYILGTTDTPFLPEVHFKLHKRLFIAQLVTMHNSQFELGEETELITENDIHNLMTKFEYDTYEDYPLNLFLQITMLGSVQTGRLALALKSCNDHLFHNQPLPILSELYKEN